MPGTLAPILLVKARGFAIECRHLRKRPRDALRVMFPVAPGSAKEVKMLNPRMARVE